MGYSSRYHVASLAAVFLALGIGILIGTGLKTVVSDTTNSLAASIRDNLQGSLDDAQAQVGALNRQLDREHSFDQAAYPGLVRGLLRGERVAVIAFGGLDSSLRSDIQQVVGPSKLHGRRGPETSPSSASRRTCMRSPPTFARSQPTCPRFAASRRGVTR